MPAALHSPAEHTNHWGISLWPLAVIGAVGAVIAAPYLLPLVGIGQADDMQDIMHVMHGQDPTAITGLADVLNRGLAKVPLIGSSLAAGGWANIATTGVIGIGGVLLANWLEKHETPTQFHWSKVIRYSAMATSALVALPSILTGISVGIAFLVSVVPGITSAVVNPVISALSVTTGTANMTSIANSGTGLMAMTLPHLLSCGAAIIPAGLAYFMGNKGKPATHVETAGSELTAPQKPLQPVGYAL